MDVVATAGHVDHGKSALVRALTGMEPDRLADEQRRGLTIDLGFAWRALPSGREVAFVDVPGHERFLSNMMAGVGPAPAVCLVVAADQGWQEQSDDHLAAITALGITGGLIVLTRADLASAEQLTATEAQLRRAVTDSALHDAPVVTVSARTGSGLEELMHTLDTVLAQAPVPNTTDRVRLWVDRSFSVKGSGTVITGTLTAGTLRVGDRLQLVGRTGTKATAVRGLHRQNAQLREITPTSRVAVNLRELTVAQVHRGDALVSPDAWPAVTVVDVRSVTGSDFSDAPQELMVYLGTAVVSARVRPLGDGHARLTLERALPLQHGDRLVLSSPGARFVFAGALVLDVDPPALARRGDGARRARELEGRPIAGDPDAEVRRRGAMTRSALYHLGLRLPEHWGTPATVQQPDPWQINPDALHRWATALHRAVTDHLRQDPLAPGLTTGAAASVLSRCSPPLPEASLLPRVVAAAQLESADGLVAPPGHRPQLGHAEAGLTALEARLREQPFAAPEADDLAAGGLGARELAAAERMGRVLRLPGEVILLPTAPALAMRALAGLEQPFTTSAARQALDTTRRVAIPLLEHLDARGWTRRVDGATRTIVR